MLSRTTEPRPASAALHTCCALIAFTASLLAGTGGCTRKEPPPPSTPAGARQDAGTEGTPVLARPAAAVDAGSPSGAQDFSSFWAEFRATALRADATSLAALTRFPFVTRGELDGDPETSHDRASFGALLERLLSQDAGMSREPEPMREYIRRVERTPSNAQEGDSARVGAFEFQRIGGRWLFVRAFLST